MNSSRVTLRQLGAWILGAALAILTGSAMAGGNWVINAGFSTSLGGWSNLYDRPASWNANDAQGVPDSGSVLLSNASMGNGGTQLILGQCVPLTPLAQYVFGASIRLPGGQPAGTAGGVGVDTYASTNCVGNNIQSESEFGTSASWEQESGAFTAGATVRSAWVWIGVSKASGVTATGSVLFDNVYLRQAGLPFDLGPGMSGSWYNPAQSGHGIMLDLLSASGAWMCWFTFDLSGNRTWICGTGSISGNTISFPAAFLVSGGKFPPLFDPNAITEVPWGSITVAFTGCNAGTMSWTTSTAGYQSGSMPLTRLTTEWANNCVP